MLIRTGHVVRIGPDSTVKAQEGTEVIDAAGKFLMPGLWDNHQHFSDNDGALDLANGVTSSRDMANDLEDFPARVARFDAGTELGPHVFKAGIIDGTGPLAGPTKMRVDTPAEALKDVAWYADHGYGQIKIYSSVKPELVPIIADAAHARGLRVSGHVPAFMSAQMFVEAGADEIQHLNFIVLNFLFDQIKDTRGTTRFTAVGEHAHELGPDNRESPGIHPLPEGPSHGARSHHEHLRGHVVRKSRGASARSRENRRRVFPPRCAAANCPVRWRCRKTRRLPTKRHSHQCCGS